MGLLRRAPGRARRSNSARTGPAAYVFRADRSPGGCYRFSDVSFGHVC